MTKSSIEDLHLRIVGTSFGTLRSEILNQTLTNEFLSYEIGWNFTH